MANYINYPAVDENYHFPPEIQNVLAKDVDFYKGQILSTENLDDFMSPGMWSYYNNNPTAPNGTSGTLIVSPILNNNETILTQLAIEYGTGDAILKRYRGSGGWSAWKQINNDTLWKKGIIPDGVDVREHIYANGEGQYTAITGTAAGTMTGLPPELMETPVGFTAVSETLNSGTVITLTSYSVWSVDRWVCTSAPSGGDGWTNWYKVKWVEEETSSGSVASSGSGFKTLPYILTAGRGGGEAKAPTAATLKYDFTLSKDIPVYRYRIAIRDGNPRWGSFTAQRIAMYDIKFGGVTRLTSMATDPSGAITYSRWFYSINGTVGDLEFRYECPEGPRRLIGAGTINGVRVDDMPFEIWLELEVPASTPAIGIMGDSNSVGNNTDKPIHDAWMSIYCRDNGYFPVLYGHSGYAMSASGDPDAYSWNRWNHLDKPDVAVHANGANDIPATDGAVTLAELQARAEAEWAVGYEKISKIQHACLIKSKASGANDAVRKAYNNWLKTTPHTIREWQDIASPVTTNDTGGLKPEYISSDNIHMNTAGQTAIARSGLLKEMTYRSAPLVRHTSAGQTVTVWDPVAKKDLLIAGDTGERDISSLITDRVSGSIRISRVGNLVMVNMDDLVVSDQGTTWASWTNLFPSGFRYSSTGYIYLPLAPASSVDSEGPTRTDRFGNLYIYNMVGEKRASGVISWVTRDPWPTTLPGTPA